MSLSQGKTYSMIGPRLGSSGFDKQQLLTENDGFLARAYANVFQSIEAQQSDMHVEVRASCCEVYHEQVRSCMFSSIEVNRFACSQEEELPRDCKRDVMVFVSAASFRLQPSWCT